MDKLKRLISAIFLTCFSHSLYAEEFTYHCDVIGHRNFSLVFDVNLTEKTITHTHSVFKNNDEVRTINRELKVFLWDEENESVWVNHYNDPPLSVPSLTTILFNFRHQTLILQSIQNDISIDRSLSEDTIIQGNRFKCFSIK